MMRFFSRLPTLFGIACLWLLHFLPLPVIARLGKAIGVIAFYTKMSRTTRINIHACFPELSTDEQQQLVKKQLGALCTSLLELGVIWWSPKAKIEQLVTFKNLHFTENHTRPIIFLTPHFVGLEMQGARMGMAFRGVSMFSAHKNPDIDRLVREARDRLGDIVMVERKQGLRPLIRGLKDGRRLYILPDMDFGENNDSVFVPFFNIPAATVTTLPRLAKLTNAVVIPSICYELPGHRGYQVEFFEPWQNYPTESLEEDVARMNQFIEQQIRRFPEQYFWGHKRFRTRPQASEPYFYRWPQPLD
jgi:KDO2-lipid IV(A) lauroyltransferase